ncbi:hypothetical protein HY407_02860 [Candidatus Gottesmanbacteria bacterium]|nr:hypothetical protein [Candidatus Gottesmanbacteria bacterium]
MRDSPEYFHHDNLPATLLFKKIRSITRRYVNVFTTAVTYNNGYAERGQMKVCMFDEKVPRLPYQATSDGVVADSPIKIGDVIVFTGPHFPSGGHNGPEKMTFYPMKVTSAA